MSKSFFSTKLFSDILKKEKCNACTELIIHSEINSTSTDLIRRLSEGAPMGTAVVSQTQTAGRGRSGNSWFSEDTQNLYISFSQKIRGDIAQRLPLVPLAAGVAAAEALHQENIEDVRLKWPNDLLIDRKKVGGILCETPGIENDSAVAVVGLGLNLGVQSFPAELQSIAANIASARPGHKNTGLRERIAARWISGLHRWCRSIQADEVALLIAHWKQHGESFGRKVKVGNIIGHTVDLTPEGRLLVNQQNGEIRQIPGGMVESLD